MLRTFGKGRRFAWSVFQSVGHLMNRRNLAVIYLRGAEETVPFHTDDSWKAHPECAFLKLAASMIAQAPPRVT